MLILEKFTIFNLFYSVAYAVPISNSYFGNASGLPIWLDDVQCSGTEPGLGACNHKPWGTSNCKHNEDVGVMCLTQGGEFQLSKL